MNSYVALLRGINVGGNNRILMVDLTHCFESLGFGNVTTYIQSGNVLFTSPETDHLLLTDTIEKALSKQFNYNARIVLRSLQEMKAVVHDAPKSFGDHPEIYRYDVLFVKEPLTVSEAMTHIPVKEGVDQLFAGSTVVYFARLISKATQSRISRMILLPLYQKITIRNWNTTTKLEKMLETFSKE